MSDNKPAPVHTDPIKNRKQLPTVVFAFAALIFMALLYFTTAGTKPVADGVNPEQAVAARIQKVGQITLREATRQPKTGEEVFKGQCTNCHTAGLLGSPKFGDAAAWAPRIGTGYEALLNSALKGKNAMPAQGGGDLQALEIGRAVVYMANAAGAKFEEPKAPPAPAEAAK